MPRWIPRSNMPQVDEADLAHLIARAYARGLHPEFVVVEASVLRSRQAVNRQRVAGMPDRLLRKPILISSDGYILDGNHRWYAAKRRHVELTCVQIGATFNEARQWLLSLTFVYTITAATPIRN